MEFLNSHGWHDPYAHILSDISMPGKVMRWKPLNNIFKDLYQDAIAAEVNRPSILSMFIKEDKFYE